MLKILEKDIEKAVVDFLTLDGWKCRKMEQNFSERKQKVVGERGMADQQCIRYSAICLPSAEVLWIELKRRTGKAMAHQMAWHQAERARGALTLIAGIDFVASIEGFQEWYRASGLCRKVR